MIALQPPTHPGRFKTRDDLLALLHSWHYDTRPFAPGSERGPQWDVFCFPR